MSKTVIALRGPTNSGKTSTLTDAHRRLALDWPVRQGNQRTPRGRQNGLPSDIVLAVVEVDGVNVGFVTIAEPPDKLKERLADLADEQADYHCPVIVCATRTEHANRRKTVEAVQSLEQSWYEIEWVEKEKSESEADYDRDNRAMADEIIRRVMAAVKMVQPAIV